MNEIRELIDMELDAVSGGHSLVDLGNIGNVTVPVTVQNNINVPTAVAVSVGGDAFGANFNGGQLNKTFGFNS